MTRANLMAVSDLHISYRENRAMVERLRPLGSRDWLLVAGDVAERVEDVEWALSVLGDRFATVVWAPGNHELWTTPDDPVRLRGEARYRHLVEMCRSLGVHTPEDPYPVWHGDDGPIAVAPLFVLYDYSFLAPGAGDKAESLRMAERAGVVCTDEFFLHPDPYESREAWCAARIAYTERRLDDVAPGMRTVLVNHYPLVPDPTRVLWRPEFAQWCGTTRTADWHRRFNAAAVVYGHLHIPRLTWHDEVPFAEVSLGYPREWSRWGPNPQPMRVILTSDAVVSPS